MFRIAITCCALTVIMLMTGCAAYKVRDANPETGEYRALSKIPDKAIKTFKPFNGLNEVSFVYLLDYSSFRNDEFEALYRASLADMGFKTVVNKDEFTQIIVKSGLASIVTSATDLVSLHRASQVMAPFLIVQTASIQRSSASFRQELKVVDPVGGATYLDISQDKFIWWHLDDELTFPTLNVLRRWVNESRKTPPPTEGTP